MLDIETVKNESRNGRKMASQIKLKKEMISDSNRIVIKTVQKKPSGTVVNERNGSRSKGEQVRISRINIDQINA